MGLRIQKSVNQRHTTVVERSEKRKIFVLAEGEKTEIKYFEGLREHSKELGISDLLEIVPLYKNSEVKGVTSPQGLADLAKEFIENENSDKNNYYEDIDKFLLIFDRDKNDFANYSDFIDSNKEKFILGITNPCFEIWLLLHKQNSVNEIIKKNEKDILDNRKISASHSYLSKIISDLYNMNTKRKMNFSKFKDNIKYAIEQEQLLTQNIYELDNKIGSNIGKIIQNELINAGKLE